jgi:hypothetical protein
MNSDAVSGENHAILFFITYPQSAVYYLKMGIIPGIKPAI